MNSVEILGVSGYEKTVHLRDNVEQALKELQIELQIKEITDVNDMIRSDISAIPALRVNSKVVVQKTVPDVEDLKILLKTLLQPSETPFRIDKILVPTDFSTTAKGAYQFAIELAKKKNAEIQLTHWFHQELDPTFPFLNGNSNAYLENKEELLANFHREAAELNENGKVDDLEIKTELLTGFATQEIVQLSKTPDVDIIVMGTTGESGLLNKLFGSVSSHVARNAHCPVLLIPKGVSYSGFNNVLYASNYHTYDEAMLQKVIDFACLFDANIHFVHVLENTSSDYRLIETRFEQIFREKAPSLGFNMVKIENNTVLHATNQYISENDIDLMVMATSHRNFIENILHRSMTKQMVFNTKIPLMVMHFDD